MEGKGSERSQRWSRQLEKQLEEALSKNKGCLSGCQSMMAAIVTVANAAC